MKHDVYLQHFQNSLTVENLGHHYLRECTWFSPFRICQSPSNVSVHCDSERQPVCSHVLCQRISPFLKACPRSLIRQMSCGIYFAKYLAHQLVSVSYL